MRLPKTELVSRGCLLAALWLLLSVTANAAVVQFFSRSDFENAITQSTLIDFEHLAPGNVNLGSSVVFGDVTISATPGRVFSTTQFGAPTVQISSQDNTPLTIQLAPGHTAIGMDVGTLNAIGTPQGFLLRGPSRQLLNTTNFVADNDFLGTPNTTFFGFVSDSDEILSLQISPGGTAFPTIDNVIFGSIAAVPEPSTLPLLIGLGSMAMSFSRKRRRVPLRR
ncbi:MAG: PEP-CTERM sorting domain-containing protein [Planctomycetales bacterium]|nr:PEP-CTERM sorting domain-containing protein [Planctomycetales bacterium]